MDSAQHKFLNVPSLAWAALRPLGFLTVFTTLVGVGSYELALLPSEAKLGSIYVAHQEQRKFSRDLRERRNNQETFVQLEKDLEKAWGLLPAQKDFSSMAIAISQLANTERVFIPGMSYSRTRPSENLPPKASLIFSASGTYPAIYRFIHQLEQSEQYLIIERLDVSRKGLSKDGETAGVQFNIKISTFLKKDPLEENAS